MKKHIYINVIASLMLLSACNPSNEEIIAEEYTISGTGEKTPLEIAVNIKDSYNPSATRALNGSFEVNDELIAYVQQVKRTGAGTSESPYSYVNTLGKKVEFTVKTIQSNGSVLSDANNADLSTILYWDDFSNTDDDIRGEDRFLRVGYGFCFNGIDKTTTSFNESTAKVDWTVLADQSAADNDDIRKSDLLWAGPQTPIEYKHIVADRAHLPVTYTHAMSKVTIELVLGEGYDVYPEGNANAGKAVAFGEHNTTPTLFANKVVTEADAINQTLKTTVASSTDTGITMYLADDEDTNDKTRVYEAIIAPTVMKAGYKLAEVTVDGNDYDIVLTNEILETVYPANSGNATWSSQLKGYTITGDILEKNGNAYDETSPQHSGITLPGINYRLVVRLLKQRIDVRAEIVPWTDVYASSNGIIMFDADVVDTDITADITSTSFDLWRSTTNTAASDYDADVTAEGIQKASTYTYTSGKWVGEPLLYWANGSTSYYFRALAKVDDPDTAPNVITTVGGSQNAAQGTDLLWAQTSKHKGKDKDGNFIQEDGADKEYAAGAAINPRTGDVPLTFEHAMSKISVELKSNPGLDAVVISGAKVSIINLYNGGTINVSTGDIESLTSPADLATPGDPRTILNAQVNSEYKLLNQIVIPQSLTEDKNGGTRGTIPTFYQSSELTLIYNDDTSLPTGGGIGTYYLTSSLSPENYVDSDLIPIYANGTSIDDGGLSRTYAISTLEYYPAQDAVTYSEAEVEELNAPHRITKILDENGKAPGDEGYIDTWEYDPGYTPKTTTDIKIPAIPAYYKANELSKPATTASIKCHKKTDSSVQHTPGELKSAGNKIMMYITLADGTRYSIELSKCKDSSNNLITEWKRGEHYTYEITLGKEEVTFRALVKEWVNKTGSGNATLDWS